jgi:oligopeptide/dipeptide ABC transporter ATP-binding protein
MLTDGFDNIYTVPAAAVAPSAAIVIAGFTFVLAGEVAAKALGATGGFSEASAPIGALQSLVGDSAAETQESSSSLLVENLNVTLPGARVVVAGVSLAVMPGEVVGITGESGAGKSLTAAAISLLLPPEVGASASRLELCGADPRRLRRHERNRLLGRRLANVFQDPTSSLNPTLRIGRQLAEVATVHLGMRRGPAMRRAVNRLAAVGVGHPDWRASQYPRELSGGMRQRAVIGMGLMGEPAVLIADEPTSSLDVIIQRRVLLLLREIAPQRGVGILLISHDVAAIGQVASRVLVMYAGRMVEELPVAALARAAHPYTRALVASQLDLRTPRGRPVPSIPGRAPEVGEYPKGCVYAPRCPLADQTCRSVPPPRRDRRGGGWVVCWKPNGDAVTADVDTPDLEAGLL